MKNLEQAITDLARKLSDEGLLIESGWVILRDILERNDGSLPPEDLHRTIFFCGAQHLFGSIMAVLDPGAAVTENDMRRLDSMKDELEAFGAAMKLRWSLPEGHA